MKYQPDPRSVYLLTPKVSVRWNGILEKAVHTEKVFAGCWRTQPSKER